MCKICDEKYEKCLERRKSARDYLKDCEKKGKKVIYEDDIGNLKIRKSYKMTKMIKCTMCKREGHNRISCPHLHEIYSNMSKEKQDELWKDYNKISQYREKKRNPDYEE